MKLNPNHPASAHIVVGHLRDAIEADRKILAAQWKSGSVNKRIAERYKNNTRKLDLIFRTH